MSLPSVALSARELLGQARAWGWPFVAGAAALAVAAILSLWLVPGVQREAQAVAAEADRAARRALTLAATVVPTDQRDTPALHFVRAFPPVTERQSRVAALLELAVRHSLSLRRSEFHLEQDKATGLLRYTVSMPLSGSYGQLRAFVEQALAGDAGLSLDHLQLRRASASTNAVDAELKWSFYMRPGADPAPEPAPHPMPAATPVIQR